MKTHNKFFLAAAVGFVLFAIGVVFAPALWPVSPFISMIGGGMVGVGLTAGIVEKRNPF